MGSTPASQAAINAEYSPRGVVLLAAGASGVSRRTVHDWLRDDPDFAAKFQQAKNDATDFLEAEARAITGL